MQDPLSPFGGLQGLTDLMDEFYVRLMQDQMIGFFFKPFPKEELVQGQLRLIRRVFGDTEGAGTMRNLKALHQPLRINAGQYARRQLILTRLLAERKIPEEAIQKWLQTDEKMKSMILLENPSCHS